MRTLLAVPLLTLALSLPAAGQDIFAPLRDMVEGITQPERQPPRRPRPAPAEEEAPVPQERPADLGATEAPPAVAPPAKPEPPVVATPVAPVPPVAAQPGVDLPRERPEEPEPEAVEPPAVAVDSTPAAPEGTTEPAEPGRIFQTACPAVLSGQVEAQALPPISEGQCQAQSPLSITGVLANGRMVPLSGAVTTDCGMASVLPDWVGQVDNYVRAHDDTTIASVTVGTGYMCRNVNNAAEGNLSFHAFADALDVVGFALEDGRSVTVEEGWTGTEAQGSRIVRFAHDAACGHFTTVLGPEANALHHDHLHLDLGCHGKSCTARLCQ
ncbi:extensin family protein [uncultured Devosia sp.]|uniref:extensin-like domain-containing protein n=1 Tax=uncultured Devosia sp. TaxID=211434 RepID=UPI0035CAFA79